MSRQPMPEATVEPVKAKARPATATKPRARRGHPPIIERGWDDTTGKWNLDSPAGTIIAAIRGSNALEVAAAAAGISRGTLFMWLARAREHRPQGDDFDRKSIAAGHRPYVDFLDAVERAAGEAETELVLMVRAEARKDARWATWLLSRKAPNRWGDRSTLQIETPDSGDEDEGVLRAILADPFLALRLRELNAAVSQPERVEDAEVVE